MLFILTASGQIGIRQLHSCSVCIAWVDFFAEGPSRDRLKQVIVIFEAGLGENVAHSCM